MATDRSVEMDTEEVHAFLGRGGTGVLSLAASDVPYSTPVSYGFDPEGRTFYFRLGFVADSEKRRFVDASTQARLVVYGEADGTWRSVVGIGRLDRIEDEDLTVDVASALRRADLPLFDIWAVRKEAIEFEIYRMDVEELTGRRTAGTDTS